VQLTDLMATHIVSVSPDTDLASAARRMVEADVGAAIVLDEQGDLAGVITERDLMRCVGDGVDPSRPVSERMTSTVLTAPATADAAEAMAMMIDGRFRHLPVVNEQERIVGLVSMRDLMAYTALRLRGGLGGVDSDVDPAELLASIHRLRTGAA
jgi:CBS domain-containing protein